MKKSSLHIIGISYRKASASLRGKFSLDINSSRKLILEAKNSGIKSIIVNSTCNRVEIYSQVKNHKFLVYLLCKYSLGTEASFLSHGYIIEGEDAVNHIFRVGTGLDSQILGDFEIIAQLRQSFKRSKELDAVNPYFNRLFNSVMQASKRIKNETKLSSGATSVSFAAVRYVLDNVSNLQDKKILLFGVGKIGRNTCENLVKHTSNKQITLINRTKDKARKIAGKFKLIVKDISEISNEISNSDILIVATSASTPTITKDLVSISRNLLILDLSVPKNVEDNLKTNPNVDLLDLDRLSNMANVNLNKRKEFIPDAENIIVEIKKDFKDWVETRKYAPTVNALKAKLRQIHDNKITNLKKKSQNFNEENVMEVGEHLIQKITNQIASHLKESKEFEEELESIKTIFQLNSNE